MNLTYNLTNAQPGRYISSDSSCAEMPVKCRRPSCEVSCLLLCLKPENKLPTKHIFFCGWCICSYSSVWSNLANSEAITFNQKVQDYSSGMFRTIYQDHWRSLQAKLMVPLVMLPFFNQCPLATGCLISNGGVTSKFPQLIATEAIKSLSKLVYLRQLQVGLQIFLPGGIARSIHSLQTIESG